MIWGIPANMLFSNVLALSFFLGGIYLLIRWQKTGQARLSFLALALLIIGVWVRYDFVIPAVIILGVFFGSGLVTGRLPRRLLIELAAFSLIPVILLLVFNYETAGSIVAVTRGDPSQTATELFWKYPLRPFPGDVLATNLRMYLLDLTPILVTLALVGIAWTWRRGPGVVGVALLLVGAFVLFYYGKNADYWGFDKNWLGSSYTRYFLPAVIALGIFGGAAGDRIYEVIRRAIPGGRYGGVLLLGGLLAVHVAISWRSLDGTDFGLTFSRNQAEDFQYFDRLVDSFPSNTVLVDTTRGGFFRKMVVSRPVFYLDALPGKELPERVPRIMEQLEELGLQVYFTEEERRDIVNLRTLLSASLPGYGFEPIQVRPFRYDAPFQLYKLHPG